MLEAIFLTIGAVVGMVLVWVACIVIQIGIVLGIMAVVYVCILKPLSKLIKGSSADD